MNSLLRGLMAGDANTNRPFPSLLLLGIVDFCCILIGLEQISVHKIASGAVWIFAGIGSGLIGYYWSQIKQTFSKKTHPAMEIPAVLPQPLPSSSVPLVTHLVTEAQSEKREMVNVTPEYLIGFYHEGHTSVQARKLAEAFLGKWMKVSGPVGDILGSYENQRMVVFSNRSIYKHDFVNMFFRDSMRFGQLSTLKPGDIITVIGQLHNVNQLEIWLDNCELVDS